MNGIRHIFLSYARRDAATVDRIVEALQHAGYPIWIDRTGILGAMPWRTTIVKAIEGSQACLFALSPQSTRSDSVREELELSHEYKKKRVPVRIADTTIPDEMKLPLVGLQIIDWYLPKTFQDGLQEVQNALEALKIEHLPPHAGPAPAPGPPPLWRNPLAVLGMAALGAALVIYAAALLGPRTPAVPDSLTPMLSVSTFGDVGLLSFALACVLACLSALCGLWKPLRSAIVGLALFLAVTVPVAIWKHQDFAAMVCLMAAVAVCASWRWKSQKGIQPRTAATSAVVLVGVVFVAATTQHVLGLKPAGTSIIGMAPFEVMDDIQLKGKQEDFSNRLDQKLAAVFSHAGLNVVPALFNSQSLDEWSFDNWRVHKAKEVGPQFVLKTSLNRCTGHAQKPDDVLRTAYIWLAEPYGRDLEPLPDIVRASGSDTLILPVRMAFRLLTTAPISMTLKPEQRQWPRRVIVADILSLARRRNMTAETATATDLLAHPSIEDDQIRKLLDNFNEGDSGCDEDAKQYRTAYRAKAKAYSKPSATQSASAGKP